jgi:hypothetical protein
MVMLGHASWTRQAVAQIETAARNLTVDELASLAAALQTTVGFLMGPNPLWSGPIDFLVDIGAPASLNRRHVSGLYGFEPPRNPQPGTWFEWPDLAEIWTVDEGSGE